VAIDNIISKRRAFRSLEKTEISEETVKKLATSAQLAPSCFNNQPWNFIFIRDRKVLKNLSKVLSRGNEWAYDASMIIAVFSRPDMDCQIKEREYFLFDTGMATAFLILKATDLGLVAHPIAGYSPKKASEILNIPEDMTLITLVIVGKHSFKINENLSDKQKRDETERPKRKGFEEYIYWDRYQPKTKE